MIRRMTQSDLDPVYAIEKRCFTASWSRETFEKSLASEACRFLVTEEDGRILGYAGIYLAPEEAELFSIACDPEEQRRGVASGLMDEIFLILKKEGAKKLYLEVRASNEAAKELYRKYGFCELGVRKEYYQNPTEDAILMAAFV